MGILDRVFGRTEPEEKRFIGGQWLAQEASSASAGVLVTQENATSIGAVYAAVKLYADTVAGLPWDTYIRIDGTRRPYRPRPRWMDFPIPNNPNFTSFEFKHRVVSSLLLDGNAFILCLRDSSDNVIETRVLDPQKVEIRTGEMGEPLYYIETLEGAITLTTAEIIHIPLFATGENHRGGIPLHMLQYPGGNTSYASVELLGIEWLRLGLGPMIARLEAAFQRIVPGAEQTFLKFTLDGLLRATTQERYNSYATALNNGFLNINEVRALEDRAPIDGGNQYWKPLNIGVVGQEPTE